MLRDAPGNASSIAAIGASAPGAALNSLPASLMAMIRFQVGFPGRFRIQLAIGILFFPGIKLAGSDVVTPAQLSGAGRLTEQLLNN